MRRDFCDRCNELIANGKYRTGDTVCVPAKEGRPDLAWTVEIKISYSGGFDWKLCPDCCHEIIDQAYNKISARHIKEESK